MEKFEDPIKNHFTELIAASDAQTIREYITENEIILNLAPKII